MVWFLFGHSTLRLIKMLINLPDLFWHLLQATLVMHGGEDSEAPSRHRGIDHRGGLATSADPHYPLPPDYAINQSINQSIIIDYWNQKSSKP